MPLVTMIPIDLDGIATEISLLTGTGLDDLASASAFSMEAGFGTTLAAYQIAGADPAVMRGVLEEIFIPRLGDGQTRQEVVEVAGREVIRVQTGPGSGEPSYLFVNGDTIWWLDAEESFLTDLFDKLR